MASGTEESPPTRLVAAPDSTAGVRPIGIPVTAMPIGQPGSPIAIPAGASLISSTKVTEVHSFAEDPSDEGLTVDGLAGAYQTMQSYGDTVSFFDRSLTKAGFHVSSRAAMEQATVWSVRCPGGEHAHVLVRDTTPTTFEVVVTNRQTPRAPQTSGGR